MNEQQKALKIFPKNIFNRAEVIFKVDRNFIFPNIPVEISWKVRNATKIELYGYGQVGTEGQIYLNLKDNTTFCLIVSDYFGVNKYFQTVNILPLPLIQTVNVPNININIHSQFNLNLPHFRINSPTFVQDNCLKTNNIFKKIINIFKHEKQ